MQTATQLLTVEDVAAELECSPLMISRVIALGTLKGTMTRDGSIRSFRVTRANLDAFVAAGCPRLTPLPVGVRHITNSEHWIEDKHISFLGRLFDEAITAKLGEVLPEPDDRLPAGVSVSPGGGTFRRVQVDVQDSAISELMNAPAPYGTRAFPNSGRLDGLPPFAGLWRDAFLADRLWGMLASVVMEAEDTGGHYPALQQLYQTPEIFKGFLDQAWQRVTAGMITATRRYHVAFTQERYRDPKALLVTAAEAVQTIEVMLVLRIERIAANRRPFIEQQL